MVIFLFQWYDDCVSDYPGYPDQAFFFPLSSTLLYFILWIEFKVDDTRLSSSGCFIGVPSLWSL